MFINLIKHNFELHAIFFEIQIGLFNTYFILSVVKHTSFYMTISYASTFILKN